MIEILIIILGTILAKIIANSANYRYDTLPAGNKKKIAGYVQHIAEVAMIGIPFTMGLIGPLLLYQWILSVIGFACIYFLLMSVGFNIGAGKRYPGHAHPFLFIGFTDPIDKGLRKLFKISNEFKPEYNNLTAKEKQKENFRKALVLGIKVVFLIIGYIIIVELI